MVTPSTTSVSTGTRWCGSTLCGTLNRMPALCSAWPCGVCVATHTPQGQALHKAGILFKVPHKVDPHHLVPVETEVVEGVTMLKLPRAHRRARDGFALTDPGTDLTGALDHANYCIWC